MSVAKPNWPITTVADNPINQSELLANTCSQSPAQENTYKQVNIGFAFTSNGGESGTRYI